MNTSHRQDINLLQNKKIKASPKLSFSVASIFSVFFFAFLLLILWGDVTELEAINKSIASLEKSNALKERSEVFPVKDIEKYHHQLERLENSLLNKYQFMANYQQITSEGKGGFYRFFYHIASLSSSNLSLSEITIYNKGKDFSLSGYAKKSKYIPIYINDLKSQKDFENVSFGNLSIERSGDDGVIRFFLDRQDENNSEEDVIENTNIPDLVGIPLSGRFVFSRILSSNAEYFYNVGSV